MPRKLATATLALEILEELGCLADIVERRVAKRLTRDFLGYGDIIAIPPKGTGVLVLQVTSCSNVSSRLKKILDLPDMVKPVLDAGNRVEVWGVNQDKGIVARSLYIGDDGGLEYRHKSDFVFFIAGG